MNNPRAFLAVRKLDNNVEIREIVLEKDAPAAREQGYTLTELVPVSVEPVAEVVFDTRCEEGKLVCKSRPQVWKLMRDSDLMQFEPGTKLFTHPPHALAAARAELLAGVEPETRTVSAEQWRSLAESATLAIQIDESIKDRAKRFGLPCPTCGNPPHALAATQAEVKRLREALEELMTIADPVYFRSHCECDPSVGYQCEVCYPPKEVLHARAALSTPADTAEYDRLVADARRWNAYRNAGGEITLRLHNSRIDLRDSVIDEYMSGPFEPQAAHAEVKS